MNLTVNKSTASKGSSRFATFTEEKYTIDYALICDVRNPDEKIYSLAIALHENGINIDSCYLFDISRSEREAHNIFDKFARLGVSPTEAPIIISEMASPFYQCNN